MEKRIIVSTTSYPERLWAVPAMLDSIFNQTKPADEVLIYLSKDQFPGEEKDLSPELKKLLDEGKIKILFRGGDLKPHKKYIYAFKDYPHDLILVIDEDLIYPRDMIEVLYNSWKKHPYATQATRVHEMIVDKSGIYPYMDWPMEVDGDIDEPQMQVYATNGAGTLYDPSLFKDYLYDEAAINTVCLRADDMWMKANELVSGIPVVTTRQFTDLVYVPDSQKSDNLCKSNTKEVRIAQWNAISKWFDEKLGRNDVLFDALVHPAYGKTLTTLPEYVEHFIKVRNNDIKRERMYRLELSDSRDMYWKVKFDYDEMRNSLSFKIGRIITFPLRKIRDLIRK